MPNHAVLWRSVQALGQAVGMPGNGGGDSLLGGQGGVDDRGSAGHVYRLEALHDWSGHLADLRRQLDGPIQQLRVRNDLRDQTHRFGPGCVNDLVGHRQPTGHRGPDDLGQPRGHACTGQDAHPGMSVSEDRSIGSHEEVTTECYLHTAGNRCPVYRSQHRLAQLGDLGDAVLGVKPFEIGRPISLNLLEIEAGAKRRIRTGQYHRTHRSIAIGLDQSGVQGADQVGVQRVSRLGTIHRQHPDRAAVLAQDKRLVHGTHHAVLGNSLSLTLACAIF